MAQPIPFPGTSGPTPGDVERLRARIAGAPEAHAAALLEAYDLLRKLHDRGILELCGSALDAGDDLLASAVGAANTPEAIRALRNLLFWGSVLGRIDPEYSQGIFQAVSDGAAVAASQRDQPVSLWKLLRRAISRDSLRGLSAGIDLLESFGRYLHSLEQPAQKGGV